MSEPNPLWPDETADMARTWGEACRAEPAMPPMFQWMPCCLKPHSILVDHVSIQDGVRITWNEARIEAFKSAMRMRSTNG